MAWGGGFNTDNLFEHLRDLGYDGSLEDMKYAYYVAILGYESDLLTLEYAWLATKLSFTAASLAFDLAGDVGGAEGTVPIEGIEDLWQLVLDQEDLNEQTYVELYT